MNFAFYDLETTGLSPEFDQPLQFAAILTDGKLEEIDRVDMRCRLAPHILPSPHALAVTGVPPERLGDPELPSLLEFAQQIQGLIGRWAPAMWTGYNSMNFDENVLRQTFYQNLLPEVYATQFNGNTRFDVLKAVQAAHVRDRDLLSWPKDERGLTLRLDRLAPKNGFEAHDAHDALGDVEATIHIARRIAGGNPGLWSELLGNTSKTGVQARLESYRPYELVFRFGGDPESCIGCFCGYSRGNGSQAAFFDLAAADPAEYINGPDEKLKAAIEDTPRIIRGIATNKAPPLFGIPDPDPEHLRRAALIKESKEFRSRVGQAMAERFAEDPDAPPKPVERQIYDGFYGKAEKRRLEEFLDAEWPRRQEIVEELEDPRLRQLGRRLVAFHSPELLSPGEAKRFKEYLRGKWDAPDAPETGWMTLGKAKAAVGELREEGSCDAATLDAIEAYVEARAAESGNGA